MCLAATETWSSGVPSAIAQSDHHRHLISRQTSSSEALIERVYWPWFFEISHTKNANASSGMRAQRMKNLMRMPANRSAPTIELSLGSTLHAATDIPHWPLCRRLRRADRAVTAKSTSKRWEPRRLDTRFLCRTTSPFRANRSGPAVGSALRRRFLSPSQLPCGKLRLCVTQYGAATFYRSAHKALT